MRTYSTPQSALNGEITKLAILECVASAALYVGIGVYFGTFKHLAVAVAVAPLMLFRTEFSAEWGLKAYEKSIYFITDGLDLIPGRLPSVIFGITGFFILVPVAGTAVRVVSTFYWLFRRPIQTLRDTPRNWMRQSLCTDLIHPPEIVPLEASTGADVPRFVDFAVPLISAKRLNLLIGVLIISPLLILGWLPPLIYRVSFKATALAYVPFVWVAHATLSNPLPLKARLERITKGELEKVRRGLSWLVLTVIVAKLALVSGWVDRGYVESQFPSQKIVTSFVVLDGWPWWQITLGADALLTFLLLFFADAALARIEGQRPWREELVLTTVAAASFLRGALALVTISHFFYIALAAAAPDLVRRLQTL